eukprot:SAG25_NODE_13555_length_265_cov_1.554217_2_plen_25_part_01
MQPTPRNHFKDDTTWCGGKRLLAIA